MNYPENNKFYRLDEMMQSQVDCGMIPGGHLRIIKDGKRIYDKCFGMADTARGLKISSLQHDKTRHSCSNNDTLRQRTY